jgi:GAF domain-containing protein
VLDPLPPDAPLASRLAHQRAVDERLDALLSGETDLVACLATVVAELHHAFAAFHWTGFYRAAGEHLVIGPYQGGHGCLRIGPGQGVCGAALRSRQTQLVPDVRSFPGHIACSATTRSELVVPVVGTRGGLGVLDIDSDLPAAFDRHDAAWLERWCDRLALQHPDPWSTG